MIFVDLLRNREDGSIYVNSIELHKFLGVKTRYNDWIKRRMKELKITSEEYVRKERKVQLKNWTKTEYYYELGLVALNKIATREKNKILLDALSDKYILVYNKKLEFEFGEMLDKITGIKWRREVNINNKYWVDFAFQDNIIVEFDEKYHNSEKQKEKDKIREREILEFARNKNLEMFGEDWTPAFIRVKEGHELEGIRDILKELDRQEFLEEIMKGRHEDANKEELTF